MEYASEANYSKSISRLLVRLRFWIDISEVFSVMWIYFVTGKFVLQTHILQQVSRIWQ